MATVIRLRRDGAKDRPHYRIVVVDSRKKLNGKYIESLGHYDPMQNSSDKLNVDMDLERFDYWRSVGAQPSESVLSLAKRARKAQPA